MAIWTCVWNQCTAPWAEWVMLAWVVAGLPAGVTAPTPPAVTLCSSVLGIALLKFSQFFQG